MKRILVAALFMFSIVSCLKDEVTAPMPERIPTPTVSFTATKNQEGIVTFNVSTANADTYSWDFGDGGTSTERLPTYTYQKNGDYVITLSAKGKGGEVVKSGRITIDNITGSVSFWMQNMKGKEVEVYVDGKYAGKITGYYSSGNPDCGAPLSANLAGLKEGVYNFTAKEANALFPSEWNGTVRIVGRLCTRFKLNY